MDPSTSNAITFNKLTDTFEDFDNWLFRIQCLLVECDLWEVCSKEVNVEDPYEIKKDEKAKSKIGQACDNSVVPIIRSAKTAYEMINRLKAKSYGGLKKQLELIKELMSNEYSDMNEYVEKILATKEDVLRIGGPVDDRFVAITILTRLPAGFEHIVMKLDHPDIQITSEKVVEALLQYTPY